MFAEVRSRVTGVDGSCKKGRGDVHWRNQAPTAVDVYRGLGEGGASGKWAIFLVFDMRKRDKEVRDRMKGSRNMRDCAMGEVAVVERAGADLGELENALRFGKDLGYLASTARFQR